jgi:hypothetical protein
VTRLCCRPACAAVWRQQARQAGDGSGGAGAAVHQPGRADKGGHPQRLLPLTRQLGGWHTPPILTHTCACTPPARTQLHGRVTSRPFDYAPSGQTFHDCALKLPCPGVLMALSSLLVGSRSQASIQGCKCRHREPLQGGRTVACSASSWQGGCWAGTSGKAAPPLRHPRRARRSCGGWFTFGFRGLPAPCPQGSCPARAGRAQTPAGGAARSGSAGRPGSPGSRCRRGS